MSEDNNRLKKKNIENGLIVNVNPSPGGKLYFFTVKLFAQFPQNKYF